MGWGGARLESGRGQLERHDEKSTQGRSSSSLVRKKERQGRGLATVMEQRRDLARVCVRSRGEDGTPASRVRRGAERFPVAAA